MAHQSSPEWLAARAEASAANDPLRALTRAARRRWSIEQALADGVRVYRLTALRESGAPVPTSYAVDPLAELDWGPAPRAARSLLPGWYELDDSRVVIPFALQPAERCLGLGERYGGLNLRGRRHTLSSLDDPDHTEATDAMYKSIPWLILEGGSRCRGIFVDSPALQRWHLDRAADGQGGVELLSRRSFRAYYFEAEALPGLVRAYTRLTGRMRLPPRWSLGHQQSRWSYPSEKIVRRLAREFRRREIPCDTLVVDIDYMQDYRVFTVDRSRFPSFERMTATLAKQGFRVVTIVDPGVKKDPKDATYAEGRRLNAFCRTPSGPLFVGKVWAGASCLPDFFDASTRRWWARKLHFYSQLGVAGLWNDMNEPSLFGRQRLLPPEASSLPPDDEQPFVHRTEDGRAGHFELRNAYGLQMARAAWESQLELHPDTRPFVLTRSCYAGMQRYGAVWLGDNKSWFEHLRLSIPMLLNMGLSGVPFCGVDVGGFGGNCDAELLVRWYQVGIFYPFFRNHCAMGQDSQEPWAFGERAERCIRALIEMRYRLLPYIEQAFAEHASDGAPLMRPLVWHYPNDPVAREVDDAFLLGRDLLVAPIVQRGQTRRGVYLPEGRWHPLQGGPALRGGRWHTLEVGWSSVPALVREGAILPLADTVQSTVELATAPICFHCFGKTARGRFRQDDGESFGYEQGQYELWELELRRGEFRSRALHRGYQAPSRPYRALWDGRARTVRLEDGAPRRSRRGQRAG